MAENVNNEVKEEKVVEEAKVEEGFDFIGAALNVGKFVLIGAGAVGIGVLGYKLGVHHGLKEAAKDVVAAVPEAIPAAAETAVEVAAAVL